MIKGYVFKRAGVWHYEVSTGLTVLHADNCLDYEQMVRDCNRSVAAFRRVLGLGYRLEPKSWRALVEKARV